MEVQLFGAAREVTGSCYSITTDAGEKILVDCGLFQGGKDVERKNYEDFGFKPSEYSALILTHAHLDHCGRIPKLVRQGFRGKIYATNATKDLASIILMDSVKIAEQDTKNENKRRAREGLPARKPIYNENDVKNTLRLFKLVRYDEDIHISKDITARFYDAGHIIGASSIQITINEGKNSKILAFSGDIGQADAVIVKNTEPIKKADYVFVESTYGDRLHPPMEDRKKEFLRIIKDTYNRGGKLMIPSFAVERAQELLYCIGQFEQQGLLPQKKVYLDSPMAIRATEVFTRYQEYYNKKIEQILKKRKDPFSFPGLINTLTVEESKEINYVTEPCIIIAGNGMCTGGRIKHHIRNHIEDSRNTLLLVGYQARGTLGYWIQKGEKRIRLLGTEVEVNAEIEFIPGFSAHADYRGLIQWLKNFSPKPKTIFIVHGEEKQSLEFEKKLQKTGMKSYIPSAGESINL